jgi:AI-2 transport system ATP-binding protein
VESIVEMKGISKAFSGVPVLQDVSFSIRSSTVHSLIGGNGAGKSTLMKILTGIYTHDGGDIFFEGKKVNMRKPSDAHQLGIYLVPQEPLLYPFMTVEENVLLGLDNRNEYRQKLIQLMKVLNCDFKLNQMADELTIAKQQLVELLRGLIRDNKVIILDEPTSALTQREVESLFANINKLKNEKNVGFVYITHRMNEIFQLSDELTILKDGKVAANGDISEFTLQKVLDIMVPKIKDENNKSKIKKESCCKELGEKIFSVTELGGKGFFDVSFDLCANEILCLTGVVGAGRTEFAEAVFGITKIISGKMNFCGCETVFKNPKKAVESGLVYLPEDRRRNGGFLISSINDNSTSAVLYKLSKFFLNKKKEREITKFNIRDLNIKCNSIDQNFVSLSGGNQQKVVLGRWLSTRPKVIILDEPTRGIDANSREEIYLQIKKLATEGRGGLVISSDFEEAVTLADKVVVMYNGKTVNEFKGDDITFENITYASFGYEREGVEK